MQQLERGRRALQGRERERERSQILRSQERKRGTERICVREREREGGRERARKHTRITFFLILSQKLMERRSQLWRALDYGVRRFIGKK